MYHPSNKIAACLLVLHPLMDTVRVVNRRADNTIGLPGGKLEGNESLIDTAYRETLEETGLDYSNQKPILEFSDWVDDYWVTAFVVVEQFSRNLSTGIEPGITSWHTNTMDLVDREQSPFAQFNKKLLVAVYKHYGVYRVGLPW